MYRAKITATVAAARTAGTPGQRSHRVNTATTVLTFLAVFLIQNSQNRDGAAIQAKLDEILRAIDTARDQFVGIEHLTDDQIRQIREALEADIRKAREAGDESAEASVERLLNRLD